MPPILWILLAVIAIISITVIILYKKLASIKLNVDNAWRQINAHLQRRFDLIPNFVELVKNHINKEPETFKKIDILTSNWANVENISEKSNIDEEISTALKTLMAVSENSSELKANTKFSELSEELRNIENNISFSKQFYNDAVTSYNEKIKIFPYNIIAKLFSFKKCELFKKES